MLRNALEKIRGAHLFRESLGVEHVLRPASDVEMEEADVRTQAVHKVRRKPDRKLNKFLREDQLCEVRFEPGGMGNTILLLK